MTAGLVTVAMSLLLLGMSIDTPRAGFRVVTAVASGVFATLGVLSVVGVIR